MKRLLLFLLLLLCAKWTLAQQTPESLYAEAAALNEKGEYSLAADHFLAVRSQAIAQGDADLTMNCMTAAGNCYYMLEWTNELKALIDEAEAFYQEQAPQQSHTVRLLWREDILKLKGSYYYCLFDADASAFAQAEQAYQECFRLLDELKNDTLLLVDDAERTAIIRRELVSLYYKKKDYQRALEYAQMLCDDYADLDEQKYNDALLCCAMCQARIEAFDEALKTLSLLPETPVVWRAKAKVLMLRFDKIGTDNRKEAASLYARYLSAKKQEIKASLRTMSDFRREEFWLSVHDLVYDCFRLGDAAPEMLYDLLLYSKGYLLEAAQRPDAQQTTWQQVRQHLGNGDCAVEFVQYIGKNDEKRMGCLLLCKADRQPQFLDLFSVDGFLQHSLSSGLTVEKAMTTDKDFAKDALYADSALFRMIWSPVLMSAIANARNIYFSPDGILHQLAVEYMLPDSTLTAYRLSSTRILCRQKSVPSSDKALFVGGIDYKCNLQSDARSNDSDAYDFLSQRALRIANLPMSRKEVDSIYAFRGHTGDILLTGCEATDEQVMACLKENCSTVHFSTHGYFAGQLSTGSDLKPLLSDKSLSHSGLLFAGASAALNNRDFNASQPDGILSAKELSSLTDFRRTNMVVLSACQTGLGYMTADGVMGIQRALKQAGVNTLMVSLWSVDETATYWLMRYFYEELSGKNKTPAVALANARKKLRQKTVELQRSYPPRCISKGFKAPHLLHPFIIIDGI